MSRLELLRRLRETRQVWQGTPAKVPERATEPVPPVGAIDAPPAGLTLPLEPAAVSGWAMLGEMPATRVDLELGGLPLGPARLGHRRPDVRAATGIASAAAAGFSLELDLAEWPGGAGETELSAVARGAGGETLTLTRPVTVLPPLRPWPAAGPSRAAGAPRVLVCTHQLSLGGAQLYLVDLLTRLVSMEALEPVVLAALDGVTRGRLEAAGIPVYVTGTAPAGDGAAFEEHVAALGTWAEPWGFESALINTATSLSFPGAIVAKRLGLPVVWAIHESLTPSLIWADLPPGPRDIARETLAGADTAIFEAAATERLFREAMPKSRRIVIPYGIDVTSIDLARRGMSRATARHEAGLPAQAKVLLCVGTVEPRKAQVPLVQAFARVADRHQDARLVFVGATGSEDSQHLREFSAGLGYADRIRVEPLAADLSRWYRAADLLVCASDVESLPRTVLEAMLWEVPVLATSIFGLPELIEDGETGWLCEARDVDALGAGLERALRSSPSERRAISARARARVERRHSMENYGIEVAALLGGRRRARN